MVRTATRLLGIFLLFTTTTRAGGWAVVTLDHLPDHVRTGQPVTFTYAVRVHGAALTDGLHGRVEARLGARVVRAIPMPAGRRGMYTATITLPQAGSWTLTIDSGHGSSGARNVSLAAIASGHPPPVFTEVERGQRLFAAKGCMTCHVHADVPTIQSAAVGPRLTGRRFDPEWLRGQLANPPRAAAADEPGAQMPDLDLSSAEIDALVAFLNGERTERAER